MTLKIFIVAFTASAVAYFDMSYGFLVIIAGLTFVLLLELWRYKKKKENRNGKHKTRH